MRPIIRESHGSLIPGQDLVMTGYAGLRGCEILAAEKKALLLQWFSRDYLESRIYESKVESVRTQEFWEHMGASEWEPVEEGGILAALWNISSAYQTGIQVVLREIPVKQAVIEICERFDLNPYCLLSDGTLLATDHGGDLVKRLSHENISSAVIGKVTSGIRRLIETGEGTSYLNRPKEDELNRVIPGTEWRKT